MRADLQIFFHVVDLGLRKLLSWSRDHKNSRLVIMIKVVDQRGVCLGFSLLISSRIWFSPFSTWERVSGVTPESPWLLSTFQFILVTNFINIVINIIIDIIDAINIIGMIVDAVNIISLLEGK